MFKRIITKKYNKLAFTLIELLVVIAIIGLLATISIVALSSARSKSRDMRRLSDIKQLQTAIEIYYQYNGYYPQYITSSRCNTNINNSLSGLVSLGLMAKIPNDPAYRLSPNPRQCYEYMGIGQADNYSFTSIWYCNGKSRTDYEWSLLFSLEGDNVNFAPLTNNTGVPNNEYKYCITGPLR